jgi:mercuric ion transport protein
MRYFFLFVTIISLAACGNSVKSSDAEKQSDDVSFTAENVKTLKFDVEGMTCSGCENTVQRKITEIEGVVEVSAHHVEKNAIVKFDASKTNVETIEKAISNAGYEVGEHSNAAMEE